MSNKSKIISGAVGAAVTVIITAVMVGMGADAESSGLQLYVDDATGEVTATVFDDYVECDGGICNGSGDLVIKTSGGKLKKIDKETIEDYRQMDAGAVGSWADYEDQIQQKIRQLAVDALHAEGIDPPGEVTIYMDDKGKITKVKP